MSARAIGPRTSNPLPSDTESFPPLLRWRNRGFRSACVQGESRSKEGAAMPTITLSAAAQDLLRRRLADEWIEVTDETRPLYRELAEAGLMSPRHSFTRGK